MRHVNGFPFTTVGVHKKSETLAVTPKEGVVIDMDNKVIKLPYGTRRDSLFRDMFSIGENVAWDLNMGADSSQFYVQEDDTIHFYILNDSLIDLTFSVNVEPKPNNFAKVSPRLIKNASGLYTYRYTYSSGVEPIDTIGNIPFDARLDTLLNYIIIEEGNTYEIIYANGQENPDLKYGDILRIKTPANTTKDYKLCIKKYSEDFLANLKHIIFPGLELWENPKTFLYSDTFLLFNSNAAEFFVELPIGTVNSPGMVAVPEFPNTRISYSPAANLVGSLQERTATITAISENKKDTLVYSFIFNVKRDEPVLDYSPFICDIGSDWTIGTFSIIQLFNPSEEMVDLTDYMMLLISSKSNFQISSLEAFKTEAWNKVNHNCLRPGYLVMEDANGNMLFYDDPNQTSTSINPKNVFSLVDRRNYPLESREGEETLEKALMVDFVMYNNFNATNIFGPNVNVWTGITNGYTTYNVSTSPGGNIRPTARAAGSSFAILKILNDSVKEGTKDMTDIENDYEIVDILNGFGSIGEPWKIWTKENGRDTVYPAPFDNRWNIYRKSNVYKGNPVAKASFGFGTDTTVLIDGEWNVYAHYVPDKITLDGTPKQYNEMFEISRSRFENHVMQYSGHLAYVLSNEYLVSLGITTNETIEGVQAGTTVADFKSKLVLPSPGVKIKVVASGGVVKNDNEQIASTDKLFSYSERGIDSVVYAISISTLSDNVLLTSSKYTVALSGDQKTGTIKGVTFGSTVADILANVSAPADAKMIMIAENGGVAPELVYNADTTKLVWDDFNQAYIWEKVAAVAGAGNKIVVTAENGNVCTYSMEWAAIEDPYVLSNTYMVDQTQKEVNFVTGPISTTAFLSKMVPAPGCTIKIINKAGFERGHSELSHDDRLIVSNGTKSVTYFIKFSSGNSYVRIKTNKSDESISVYPNPGDGIYNVKVPVGASKLSVYDVTGKLRKTQVVNSGEDCTLNISNYTQGIYIVKFDTEAQSIVKVVKK